MASLRAVGPDEPAPKAQPRKLPVTKAASEGSPLELLMAMRDRIATEVEDPNCPPRDLAALTRRLLETSKEIEAIKAREDEEREGAGARTPDAAWEAV